MKGISGLIFSLCRSPARYYKKREKSEVGLIMPMVPSLLASYDLAVTLVKGHRSVSLSIELFLTRFW